MVKLYNNTTMMKTLEAGGKTYFLPPRTTSDVPEKVKELPCGILKVTPAKKFSVSSDTEANLDKPSNDTND